MELVNELLIKGKFKHRKSPLIQPTCGRQKKESPCITATKKSRLNPYIMSSDSHAPEIAYNSHISDFTGYKGIVVFYTAKDLINVKTELFFDLFYKM